MPEELLEDTRKPLLTYEQIDGWKAEYVKLSDQIAEKRREIHKLGHLLGQIEGYLTIAVPFAPELKKWISEQNDSSHQMPLTEAIAALLEATGHEMSRDDIRSNLPSMGYSESKLAASPNYYYTALRRLVERGVISESSPGAYVFVPNKDTAKER